MLPPFIPTGKTILVAGATTAPTGIEAPATTAESDCFRIHNAGTVLVHVAFGATAALAQTNCVIPTGGGSNSKDSFPLPTGAIEVISAPKGSFWSAITASSTASVYVTPGRGL